MKRVSIRTANGRAHRISATEPRKFPGYELVNGRWRENRMHGSTLTRGSKRRYRYVQRSVKTEREEVAEMAAWLTGYTREHGSLPKWAIRGWPKNRAFKRALRLARSSS